MDDQQHAAASLAVDTLARTMWGEARGCGAAGMAAVACVVMNRARHGRWWGHTVEEVCLHPYQFSCWNARDPNRAKVLAVGRADIQFCTALDIAQRAVAGLLPDLTAGADSYYALTMPRPPAWAERAAETYRDRWHVFLRLEAAAPGSHTPRVPDGEPAAPAVSARQHVPAPPDDLTADDLNLAQLEALLRARAGV